MPEVRRIISQKVSGLCVVDMLNGLNSLESHLVKSLRDRLCSEQMAEKELALAGASINPST